MNKIYPKTACVFFTRAVGESMEEAFPYFVSYIFRPKKAIDYVSVEKESPNAQEFAIIIQGPLVLKNNFTLESVRLYAKIYPGVLVIISTWDTENLEYIEKLRTEKNCRVILNEAPPHGGFMNFNFQTKSTVAGLKYAKEQGKTFIFKTRSDYRFAKRGLLEYMRQMLFDYPCGGNITHQKFRILMTSGRWCDMFKPFYIGDQFNFGYIDDLLNFWDFPMIEDRCTFDSFVKMRNREHFTWKKEREYCAILVKRFVQKMSGDELEISVDNYWRYAKDYLIFMNANDVNAFWYKYSDRYEESMHSGEFYRVDSEDTCYAYNWDFVNWNNLYHGSLKYSAEMEDICEKNHY